MKSGPLTFSSAVKAGNAELSRFPRNAPTDRSRAFTWNLFKDAFQPPSAALGNPVWREVMRCGFGRRQREPSVLVSVERSGDNASSEQETQRARRVSTEIDGTQIDRQYLRLAMPGEEPIVVRRISGTVDFFKAMSPILFANLLTVAFVYCFAKISQKERNGEEEGELHLPLAARPRVPVYALRVCSGVWSVAGDHTKPAAFSAKKPSRLIQSVPQRLGPTWNKIKR